jgi:hypothetical protein
MPLADGTLRVNCRVNGPLPRDWCRRFGRSTGVIPHVDGGYSARRRGFGGTVSEFH